MRQKTPHRILSANAHRPVPEWVHAIAATKSVDMHWAGRNDCPTNVAQAVMETALVEPTQDSQYWWYRMRRMLKVATILATRDDLDLPALIDVAGEDEVKCLVEAFHTRTLTVDHIVVANDAGHAEREYVRYAKYLVQMHKGKSIAMTGAEWMTTRSHSTDTLVSVLAANVIKLGDNRRLLHALRRVAHASVMGRDDLGYLCRHNSEHSTTNPECLYHALGQYDANNLLAVAPEWTVGWLDALEPEARTIALAVLESGSAGSTMQTVTDAAIAVASV
jgi:hypothetical protein